MKIGVSLPLLQHVVTAAAVVAALWHAPPAPAQEGTEEELIVEERQPFWPNVPLTFGSSDIKDWYARDSRTLIINTYAHGKFKATLASPCHGIRFAETIGFSTIGRYELDRSTRIVLPDGEQCFFQDLAVYTEEEEKVDGAARGRQSAGQATD